MNNDRQTPLPDSGRERLLILAEHLEKGKLGHDQFSLMVFDRITPCGTAGCAIGECPTIWPDHWDMWHSRPILKDSEDAVGGFDAAMLFFDIPANAVEVLFDLAYESKQAADEDMYYEPPPAFLGVEQLNGDATKEEVAANIRLFCDRYQWEKEE